MTTKWMTAMLPMTRRQFSLRTAALATTFALAGCGGGDDGSLILAVFFLTALIGGVSYGGVGLRLGGNRDVTVQSGVPLTIDCDVPVTFTVGPTSMTIATPVVTSRSWSTAGITTSVAGQFVITIVLIGDSSVYAFITVHVTPK